MTAPVPLSTNVQLWAWWDGAVCLPSAQLDIAVSSISDSLEFNFYR